MKLRIKEMVFLEISLFMPQVYIKSIREGYTLNNICHYKSDRWGSSSTEQDINLDWCNLSNTAFNSYEEAKRICDETREIPSERKIIIHELPEKINLK